MQKLTYIDAAEIILSQADTPLKLSELWQKIEDSQLHLRLKSTGETPGSKLSNLKKAKF